LIIFTKSVSDFDVDVKAATDSGECDPDDGEVNVCDDVIGGGCSDDGGIGGGGPEREPPKEQRAELIRPKLPPGEVR
jgi:hypothetical protein